MIEIKKRERIYLTVMRHKDCIVEEVYNLLNNNVNVLTIITEPGFAEYNKTPEEVIMEIATLLYHCPTNLQDDFGTNGINCWYRNFYKNDYSFIDNVICNGLSIVNTSNFGLCEEEEESYLYDLETATMYD